ncbi:MAG TPA: hypothetical protein PLU58_05370 [Saprospiraceae bacterium]|jgi:hypothetical protein|nr:hypothetical protein [Saprospiraceae bacterium]
MKTLHKVPLELVEVEFIPPRNEMEFGKLYYSKEYKTTNFDMKNRISTYYKSLLEAGKPLFLLSPCYLSGFIIIFCAVASFSVFSNHFAL